MKSLNSLPEALTIHRESAVSCPEQISSSAVEVIILNVFSSRCHEWLPTCWPPASVRPGQHQTDPNPDWLERVLTGLCSTSSSCISARPSTVRCHVHSLPYLFVLPSCKFPAGTCVTIQIMKTNLSFCCQVIFLYYTVLDTKQVVNSSKYQSANMSALNFMTQTSL